MAKIYVSLSNSSTLRFTSSEGPMRFTSVTDHGQDGNGFTVFSGLHSNGHPSVLIVDMSKNKLVASSVNDGTCKTLAAASAKADWAVANSITRYWNSANKNEKYALANRSVPVKLISYKR